MKIGLIGEGDFSFALALAKKLPGCKILVTELRQPEELTSTYGERYTNNIRELAKHKNVTIKHGIDAARLDQAELFQPGEDWLLIWMAPYIPVGAHSDRVTASKTPISSVTPATPDKQNLATCLAEYQAKVKRRTGTDVPKRKSQHAPDRIAHWSAQQKTHGAYFNALKTLIEKGVNIIPALGIPIDLFSQSHRSLFFRSATEPGFTPDKRISGLDELHSFRTTANEPDIEKQYQGTFTPICFLHSSLPTAFKQRLNNFLDENNLAWQEFIAEEEASQETVTAEPGDGFTTPLKKSPEQSDDSAGAAVQDTPSRFMKGMFKPTPERPSREKRSPSPDGGSASRPSKAPRH